MTNPIWEEIVSDIDDIVMSAVELSIADLASVINTHDKLIELSDLLSETEFPGISKVAQKAAELAMSIVLQESDNPEETLDKVIEAVSCLQCIAREILKGGSPEYIPLPDTLEISLEELFEKSEVYEEVEDSEENLDATTFVNQEETGEISQETDYPGMYSTSVIEKPENKEDEEFQEDEETAKEDNQDNLEEGVCEEIFEEDQEAMLDDNQVSQENVDQTPHIMISDLFSTNDSQEEIVECDAPEYSQEDQQNIRSITSDSVSLQMPNFDLGSLTLSHLLDFLNEMFELISTAERQMLALEKSQGEDTEAVQELLGVFHTIKGIAGIVKLQEITELTHKVEVFLEDANFSSGIISLVFEVIDTYRHYCNSLQHFHDHGSLVEVPNIKVLLKKLGKEDPRTLETQEIFKDQQPKAQIINVDELFAPQVQNVDSKQSKTGLEQSQTDEEPLDIVQSKEIEENQEPTKVTSPKIDPQLEQPKEQRKAKSADTANYKVQSYQQDMIKVSTKRLDALINIVGELVTAQAMLEHSPEIFGKEDGEVIHNITVLSKITRELQELSMSMRMSSLQSTFQAMERVVRDLVQQQNKKIDVVIRGEHTELDRNIIEAMYHPLIHLVRNCVAHGIETAEERVKKNKSERGLIELIAYHRGENIIIEIKDDGRGLQFDKILQQAIQKNILRAHQEYSQEEILKAIFTTGFSTAEQVTEISGRGVGLDVVKKTVEKFHGHLEVQSEPKKGCIFRIRLPLTLAIIDGMLVRIREQRYIIPLIHIEEFVKITPSQISTVTGQGEVFVLRKETLPIFNLAKFLGLEGSQTSAVSTGVIVSWKGKRCCFLIDEIVSQQQVVIKSLGEYFDSIKGISGAAILGDGRVSLILDLHTITQSLETKIAS